jgi:archaellum component FlaF (FlaF/FlaG flagellin family)
MMQNAQETKQSKVTHYVSAAVIIIIIIILGIIGGVVFVYYARIKNVQNVGASKVTAQNIKVNFTNGPDEVPKVKEPQYASVAPAHAET